MITEICRISFSAEQRADAAMSKRACAAVIETVGAMIADETIFQKQKIKHISKRKKQMNPQKNKNTQCKNPERNKVGEQNNPGGIIIVSFVGFHKSEFLNYEICTESKY